MSFMFLRFDDLLGFSFSEVALCFGVTGAAFALAESFARGFDAFSGMVIHGDFDRVLLRPRSTIIQILGSKTDVTRIGRILVSLGILFAVIPMTDIAWDAPMVFTLVMMVIGGAVLFTSVFILGATVCFFTLEGLEVINIFTDGGRELASYPLTIYGRWVTRFFTFVIPYATMNYLPLLYLMGRAERWPGMFMPVLGILFIVPCIAVWRIGIRHYTSSGS
jgi:ABC-2 type transport system permease protein